MSHTPAPAQSSPFKPIAADDVTDEMVSRYLKTDIDYLSSHELRLNKQVIAETVNAWGAKK